VKSLKSLSCDRKGASAKMPRRNRIATARSASREQSRAS
jgi:hypothetical protein